MKRPEIATLALGASANAHGELAAFYGERLGLSAGVGRTGALTVRVGPARLSFSPAPGEPYHHFALLVPGDRFAAAHGWIAERVELLSGSGGSDVFEFDTWPAQACYFVDPAGNIVELIGHPGIADTGTAGPRFEARELAGISEAGLVAADLPAAARTLAAAGIEIWDGDPTAGIAFAGRRAHTVVLSAADRNWMPTQRPATPFPVAITLAGGGRELVITGDSAGAVEAVVRPGS